VLWFFKNIQTTSIMTQHYIPEGETLNDVYKHPYLHFRSPILFMPTLRCWSRCTAPHKEVHNMTINGWTIWLFTVHCQPAYWGKQLTFIETFNWTWILLHTHRLITNTLSLAELTCKCVCFIEIHVVIRTIIYK
jgi:hypothetical protein